MAATASEDLHAWSIYRQNLNSDFTDSALGSSEKSPLPYGDFHLHETTMQSILNNPRYRGQNMHTTSNLANNNMFAYLKFGLPRVLYPAQSSRKVRSSTGRASVVDSTDEEFVGRRGRRLRAARSSEDVLMDDDHRSVMSSVTQHRRYHRRNRSQGGHHEGRGRRPASHLGMRGAFSESELAVDGHRGRRALRGDGAFVNQMLDEEDELSDTQIKDDDDDDDDLDDDLDEEDRQHPRRPNERAESRWSVATHLRDGQGISYRQEAPMLNDKYFSRTRRPVMNRGRLQDGFMHPHLQLRNVTVARDGVSGRFLLDEVNAEVRGGELLAILATDPAEGRALCEVFAGARSPTHGELILNGVPLSHCRLASRVAFVRRENSLFTRNMSTRQTLLFHAFLSEPGSKERSKDPGGRIDALIEDLGLAQVRHTRVQDLTQSELGRLNVCLHLLVDADIVVLDEPTLGMDIFDTFFLIEYLRQWAARGRVVITTLHPPTYEILTMIAKVLLLSNGKTMYCGKRREMLPYFAFIEYPCPAYKNPSDYYLDLVTLDDLSHEALLESGQRIEQLASAFRRRAEALSDPGPPSLLPPKIKRANFLVQLFGLWMRSLVYMYPFNVLAWTQLTLLSGLMSTLLGSVFLGVRWKFWDDRWLAEEAAVFEQHNVFDRMGFQFVFLVLGVWPIINFMANDEWRNKDSVTADVKEKLYSKTAYIIAKVVSDGLSSLGPFLAYLVPGYLLTGLSLSTTPDLMFDYVLRMLLYLYMLKFLSSLFVHLFNSKHVASMCTIALVLLASLVSGLVLVHPDDLADNLRWLSPIFWTASANLRAELTPINTLRCSSNPVVTDQAIIKQVPCGLPDGSAAIRYFQLDNELAEMTWAKSLNLIDYDTWDWIVMAVFVAFVVVLSSFVFVATRQRGKRRAAGAIGRERV